MQVNLTGKDCVGVEVAVQPPDRFHRSVINVANCLHINHHHQLQGGLTFVRRRHSPSSLTIVAHHQHSHQHSHQNSHQHSHQHTHINTHINTHVNTRQHSLICSSTHISVRSTSPWHTDSVAARGLSDRKLSKRVGNTTSDSGKTQSEIVRFW